MLCVEVAENKASYFILSRSWWKERGLLKTSWGKEIRTPAAWATGGMQLNGGREILNYEFEVGRANHDFRLRFDPLRGFQWPDLRMNRWPDPWMVRSAYSRSQGGGVVAGEDFGCIVKSISGRRTSLWFSRNVIFEEVLGECDRSLLRLGGPA